MGEDIGEGTNLADGKICLGRDSDREVVLVRYLDQKLREFNPGLPDDAYQDAVRQITDYTASQTTVATNREKYDLLKNGVQVAFRNDLDTQIYKTFAGCGLVDNDRDPCRAKSGQHPDAGHRQSESRP